MHNSDSLGEGARDVLADLAGKDGLEPAREGLEALAEALGEDVPGPPPDPGLPEDYRVLGVLGSGGSGVVYHAQQVSLEREVAVKVLHPGGSPQGTERLLVEARQLAALRHPAIVTVHEVGRARGGVYMTLDLARGGSLQELLQKGALNPAQAARLVRQAGEGIAFTHSRGVVHLDLKPGNVLLDEEGNARVADFGLAREMDLTSLSVSGTGAGLLGTPAYMAPEQAADRRAEFGERTDVYGLGALLYACVAGTPPCERANLGDTLSAVRFEEPEPLHRCVPGTPRDLAAIASKALAKHPDQRYESVSAMVSDLAHFEAGEPVEARLPGGLARVARALRRNGRDIAVGLLAALMGGLAVLPSAPMQGSAAEPWLLAAEELADLGEGQATERLLNRMGRRTELSVGQRRRADLLLARAQLATSETPQEDAPPRRARRLGLEEPEWLWLEGVLGKDALRGLSWRAETDLAQELAWRGVLESLAQAWDGLDGGDRDQAVELVAKAPQWGWAGGFTGWLENEPGDALELMQMLVAGATTDLSGVEVEILLDVFVVDREGRAECVARRQDRVAGGEKIRFEGTSHASLTVPRDRAGIDLLGTAPSSLRGSRPGEVWYEVQGELVGSAAGPFWRVFDRESVLALGHQDGSRFLRMASSGLLAGGAAVLEAHTYGWDGEDGATILILAEARPVGGAPSELALRGLQQWRELLLAGLRSDLEQLAIGDGYSRLAPGLRARLVDRVVSLAVLGGAQAREAVSDLTQRFPDGHLARLSDGFFERGTFTSPTTAGADLGVWTGMMADGELDAPAALLGALPRPGSASGQTGDGLGWKGWLNMTYLLVALINLILWLRLPPGSKERLQSLAVTLALTVMCLDRTVLPQLGSWPMDAIGCALLAACCLGLAPWAGRWGRICAWLFLVASLQELAGLAFGVSWPKLPLALAFAGFAGMRRGLDLRSNDGKGLDWIQIDTLVLYLPFVGILTWGGLPRSWGSSIYVLQATWSFVLFLSVCVSAFRRGGKDNLDS